MSVHFVTVAFTRLRHTLYDFGSLSVNSELPYALVCSNISAAMIVSVSVFWPPMSMKLAPSAHHLDQCKTCAWKVVSRPLWYCMKLCSFLQVWRRFAGESLMEAFRLFHIHSITEASLCPTFLFPPITNTALGMRIQEHCVSSLCIATQHTSMLSSRAYAKARAWFRQYLHTQCVRQSIRKIYLAWLEIC